MPPERWADVRQCTKHACRAPQEELLIEKILLRVPISEDCLYLNVFAPDWEPPPEQVCHCQLLSNYCAFSICWQRFQFFFLSSFLVNGLVFYSRVVDRLWCGFMVAGSQYTQRRITVTKELPSTCFVHFCSIDITVLNDRKCNGFQYLWTIRQSSFYNSLNHVLMIRYSASHYRLFRDAEWSPNSERLTLVDSETWPS